MGLQQHMSNKGHNNYMCGNQGGKDYVICYHHQSDKSEE